MALEGAVRASCIPLGGSRFRHPNPRCGHATDRAKKHVRENRAKWFGPILGNLVNWCCYSAIIHTDL